VYVGDVARAFLRALPDDSSVGERYPLCGPKVYTLRELVTYAGELSGHRRPILPQQTRTLIAPGCCPAVQDWDNSGPLIMGLPLIQQLAELKGMAIASRECLPIRAWTIGAPHTFVKSSH
jgi:hypothetical protein